MIKNKILINKKKRISNKDKCFIVAEISGNHAGSLKILKRSMIKAKQSGADAVKIQTYEAKSITLKSSNKNFFINDKSIWRHKEIFRFAKKNDIICFSSPFDLEALKLLKKLNCPIYKIASPEIEDQILIENIAKTKKPIIISTGIASEKNIKIAINIFKKYKNFKIILLNCISSYPAKNIELNLNHIETLKKYTPIVGYSDHSQSDLASIISVAKGAKVIEKHFILKKNINSPDRTFSYSPKEFRNLVKLIRETEVMLGKQNIDKKKILKDKLKTVSRSLFYSQNIKKGANITLDNVKSVRPGSGLKLSYHKKILGKRVKRNCKFANPVRLEDLA